MEKSSFISSFNDFSKEEKIQIVSTLFDSLKSIHNTSAEEILHNKEVFIPIGVFNNDKLSSLENIVKYLRENLNIKFSKIAKLINRSSKTIWATYHNASRKMSSLFPDLSRKEMMPVSLISDRRLSVLESVVLFLKQKNYSNHEIAVMMQRDDRTIWSVCDRAKKKSKK